LLNIVGLKPGDTVLDPMMGSGTTLIEAAVMGIKSVGFDVSPFCVLMAQAKLDGLYTPPQRFMEIAADREKASSMFNEVGHSQIKGKGERLSTLSDPERKILTLAFLDSVGYSSRSSRLSQVDAFQKILEKYAEAMTKFQKASQDLELNIGTSLAQIGDARHLELPDDSVDAILFSPPYSFAVDYVANDQAQLDWLKVDVGAMRQRMVGLRGKNKVERVQNYRADAEAMLRECWRVLKPKRFCVVVVGTNSRQLEVLRETEELSDLENSLEEMFVNLAAAQGLAKSYEVRRPITGMANTMREESILFFSKA